ncbi:MAG: alpha/beta hydrolase [Actinomycetota bacterium]|nr:alpha/beta hydrolase [Actinomycetota bacterium]MDQ3679692.1 alpha/beta hydrolase [Actinomycetota bacterium]
MVAPTEVTLTSDGLQLAGHLRVPSDGAHPLPGLVFTGPLTGVKDQVAGRYAEALAAAGYVTLAFDHRNFGASEGTLPQHEDPVGKLADLRNALSWLAAHPAVDAERLGCVGICLGGGYALRFAAFDPRVRALVTVAGGYNDPRAMRDGMGVESYRAVLADQMALAARQHATGEIEYMAAVSDDDTPALMGGAEPFAYYGTERSQSPVWVNRITRTSLYSLLTADLAMGADFISPTPWLMVHGRADDYCSPAGAEATMARAGEPKEAVWLDTTNHIDLYDVPAYLDPAVAAAAAWLGRWL